MKSNDDHNRVVITGIGIITTLGQNQKEYYNSLVAGKSGISRWKHMDKNCYSKIGGDLSEFDYKLHLETYGKDYPQSMVTHCRKILRSTPLSGQISLCAALQAYTDSGISSIASKNPYQIGHVMGGHNLNANFIYRNTLTYSQEPEYIEPLYGMTALDTDVLAIVNELLDLHGMSFSVGGACASSNIALMTGLNLIRSGQLEMAVVTGAASDLDPVCLQGWAILDALSFKSFNEHPEQASRPFDSLREGFVPAQASAAVVLERLSSAHKRGAKIYAELLGAACNSDASRLTKPNKNGQVMVMQEAIRNARINIEDIGYINAHATSTPLGDKIEVMAIKELFGDYCYKLLVNSTKSMVGHCLLSASLVECIATILQLKHGVIHPTINLDNPDPELDLNFVAHHACEKKIEIALSNAFGFGGINSAIILKAYD